MAVINHAKREINAKIVYYGPAASGKGSLFRYIHQRIKPNLCGPLKSMPAGGDNLLFFDYLPFEQAALDGYQIRFHLYTLTGPVANPGTWKMVLKGLDGLALVAEAGKEQDSVTQQALRTLQAVLAGHGRDLRQLPCVLISSKAERIESQAAAGWGANLGDFPTVRSSSQTGEGVVQALATLSQMIVQQLRMAHEPPLSSSGATCCTDADVAGPASTPTVDASQSPSIEASRSPAAVELGGASVVRLPLTLQVGGQSRHFSLRVTLELEEVDNGSPDI